jgi:hypothetical protein
VAASAQQILTHLAHRYRSAHPEAVADAGDLAYRVPAGPA